MQSIEVESRTDKEIQILEDKVLDLLWFLTKIGKAVCMMANGYGYSVEEIAEYTKMASGTIKSILDRSEKTGEI